MLSVTRPGLGIIEPQAAQLLAVDGEIRQLVEVKLNVVHVELQTERAVERRQGRQVIPLEGSGPSSGQGRGKFWQGDPVKTTQREMGVVFARQH